MQRAAPLVAGTAAGALFVWLAIGAGFVNYDTLFNLTWGDEVAHGGDPRLATPLAPTPKPLVIAAGAVLAPLGHTSQDLVTIGALLALGMLAAAAAMLAAHFAGWPAALLAAGLVLTREPVLSFGVRAYVDIPYAALVILAVAVALRHRRAHATVLGLLAVAGLLRPEAWLFSGVYLVAIAKGVERRHLAGLAVLAGAGPLVWALTDLALAGDPLFSLLGTRGNAEVLERATGLGAAIELTPRRLGEIVREPVLFASLGGAVLCLTRLGGDGRRLLGVVGLGLAAFALLATAGLPVLGRYLMLDAMLLVVLAAVGVVEAFRLGVAGHHGWLAFGVAGAALVIAFAPAQAGRLDRLRATVDTQVRIADDLHALADGGVLSVCESVRAPNHRLRPMLAAWLHRPAHEIAAGGALRGVAVVPATRRVERLFILDPKDPSRTPPTVLTGSSPVGGNASWRAFRRCATPTPR